MNNLYIQGQQFSTCNSPFPQNQSSQSCISLLCTQTGTHECQDCQGYSTSYLCAHAVAASLKRGSLETYVKWLVANKRKTGVLNYSRAITFGMPAGKRQEGRTTAKKKTRQRNNQYDRPKKLLAIHAKYWGK